MCADGAAHGDFVEEENDMLPIPVHVIGFIYAQKVDHEEAHVIVVGASVRWPECTKTLPSDLVSSSPALEAALRQHAFSPHIHQCKCSGVVVILPPAGPL